MKERRRREKEEEEGTKEGMNNDEEGRRNNVYYTLFSSYKETMTLHTWRNCYLYWVMMKIKHKNKTILMCVKAPLKTVIHFQSRKARVQISSATHIFSGTNRFLKFYTPSPMGSRLRCSDIQHICIIWCVKRLQFIILCPMFTEPHNTSNLPFNDSHLSLYVDPPAGSSRSSWKCSVFKSSCG